MVYGLKSLLNTLKQYYLLILRIFFCRMSNHFHVLKETIDISYTVPPKAPVFIPGVIGSSFGISEVIVSCGFYGFIGSPGVTSIVTVSDSFPCVVGYPGVTVEVIVSFDYPSVTDEVIPSDYPGVPIVDVSLEGSTVVFFLEGVPFILCARFFIFGIALLSI